MGHFSGRPMTSLSVSFQNRCHLGYGTVQQCESLDPGQSNYHLDNRVGFLATSF